MKQTAQTHVKAEVTSQHYQALLLAYTAAMVGWLIIRRLAPSLWPPLPAPKFENPWKEIGWVLIAVTAIIALGQLYQRGIRLPGTGPFGPVLEGFNHVLIFSPILVLLIWRRQSLSTSWIVLDRLWLRIGLGLCLALFAILLFTIVGPGSKGFFEVVAEVYRYDSVTFAVFVQVLFEDIAMAVLFIRIRAAIGLVGSIVLVAALFAAAHIPAMLAGGASLSSLGSLALDTGLGVMILAVVQRSRDISWFWCIHSAMDLMQFQ